jgi:hypothetical protein
MIDRNLDQNTLVLPDKTELHAVKPVKKEKQLVGRLVKRPGQIVFQLDMTTREISEAEYEVATVDFNKVAKHQVGQLNHKLIIKENHLYCVAINRQNADKHFMKMLGLNPIKLKRKDGGKWKVVPAKVVQDMLDREFPRDEQGLG